MNLTFEEHQLLQYFLKTSLEEKNDPIYQTLLNKVDRAFKHPQPFITADIVLWRFIPGSWDHIKFNEGQESTEILLIKRAKEPYLDYWALPGGHFDIESDESINHAALREMEEETGIKPDDLYGKTLKFEKYFDNKKRDTRGRSVTFVFNGEVDMRKNPQIVAADDAKDVRWVNRWDLASMDLAFDHGHILRKTNWIKV